MHFITYHNYQQLWAEVRDGVLLQESSLVLGGCINLTTYTRKIHGVNIHLDPLSGLFNHIFQDAKLIDVHPLPLTLTLRNGRASSDRMANHLDRSLMDEGLTDSVDRFKYWMANVVVSDHMPIFLNVDVVSNIIEYPFKFNHQWNEEESFTSLVGDKWEALPHFSNAP